jgi:lipopolysaccharide transport system ATP-binding protein
MTQTRIEIDNLNLLYPLGPFVRGSLKSQLMRLVGHKEKGTGQYNSVHALSGITLRVNHGERVGVIGRNGSGKSTLLRAIAGIYPPSSGRVSVTGHIQSLFDISVGFESESTGRENIFYRGLVMGVTPKVIKEREEEIIAFADIGTFIDLPMRTYSAGMSVRLAFAISTYLEGEVLLVDEVFGAGDAAFAAKASARIRTVIANAGLMVFVSHDLGVVEEICTRCIWLSEGKIKMDGAPHDVCMAYRTAVLA